MSPLSLNYSCIVRTVFPVIIALVSLTQGYATHLRAGQIIAERIGCTLTFRITITVYTDTESGVQFGGEYLHFGDGQSVFVPDMASTPLPGVPFLGTAKFTTTHTFSSGASSYLIWYSEEYRNRNVLNMNNSGNTRFYLETKIILDPFLSNPLLGCNSTPVMLVPPIDDGCTGVAFFHNPGAYDPDGDSLSYELVVPKQGLSLPVDGYLLPDDSKFYTSLDYNHANEAGTGVPTISLDPLSGTIMWDAPGTAGEYNIAFIVKEWRKVDGQWYELGFVRRDMQIIISDCTNNRPELIVPNDTCIEAGTTLKALIRGVDEDGDDVKLEAFSEIFNYSTDSAYYEPYPPAFQPADPEGELDFTWTTTCSHVRKRSYQVVFKISDDPPNGPVLTTFATWNITVIPMRPKIDSVSIDLVNRHATLHWNSYACSEEVDGVSLQVWRRIDSVAYTPDHCVTGMPGFLGYTLIATVDAGSTEFKDTNNGLGLHVGASYCYRIVAVFPLPDGSQSQVSEEVCIAPIEADAPVITNVSVERTGENDGEVRIKWMPPFDIDTDQFPPPYSYVVQRSNTFAGPFQSGLVHTGQRTELEVVDAAINTRDSVYYYRVLLFVPSLSIDIPVDTSAVASTVRLDLQPGIGLIGLDWKAMVPWSNQIQTYPAHEIYRGPENAVVNSELSLYDESDVLLKGFNYTDDGPFEENKTYCYQVVTKGGFGNPAIDEPLLNYSQIICAQPADTIPPCKPILTVDQTDCEEFLRNSCNFDDFRNTLTWSLACNDKIRSYRIYFASSVNGEYKLLRANVTDTFYVDDNLVSYARCYRISAVDDAGYESEWSDPVCNDNCPYFELPNIFTPNNDQFNDVFSAFNVRNFSGDEDFYDDLLRRCARFVENVAIQVFNRWGKEVYTYESGGENSIYIDWNGVDKHGHELPSAVYFYSADVTFDVLNPKERKKTYKGWVHLVR